jgi:voltage-gated potassium channel
VAVGGASGASGRATPTNEERLERWERRTRPAIIAAAVVPLVGVSTGPDYTTLGAIIEIVSWVVFLVDLVVHVRLRPHYLRSGVGRFDLTVVILTSPWYLFFGDGGQFVALLRLARLARVAMIGVKTPLIKRLLERLGRPFLYVAIMLFLSAAIVQRAEDHKHGFATFGDSLWWGIVTITTVGYGDIVPESRVGRITATALMLTGVALLGTVAASLASLFRAEDVAGENFPEAEPDLSATPQATSERSERAVQDDVAQVLEELRSLRAEVAALRDELQQRPDP